MPLVMHRNTLPASSSFSFSFEGHCHDGALIKQTPLIIEKIKCVRSKATAGGMWGFEFVESCWRTQTAERKLGGGWNILENLRGGGNDVR